MIHALGRQVTMVTIITGIYKEAITGTEERLLWANIGTKDGRQKCSQL